METNDIPLNLPLLRLMVLCTPAIITAHTQLYIYIYIYTKVRSHLYQYLVSQVTGLDYSK